jgi:hypothetical protein
VNAAANNAEQIAALTAQVASLTASVSANSSQIATNISSIASLAFADSQAFVVKSVPDSGIVFASTSQEILYEDPPEVGISGRYVFKITGEIETGSAEVVSTAQLIIDNTIAGPSISVPLGRGQTNEPFSYTGFIDYVVGNPFPSVTLAVIITNAAQWGFASVSLTFYRVQQTNS